MTVRKPRHERTGPALVAVTADRPDAAPDPSSGPAPEPNGSVIPRPGTSADHVHREILALVMSGELRPGDALSEVALARRFAVSRTPVREAIQRLAHSGLAERGARRTHVLRELRVDALDDAFEALAEIEALAAGLAAHRTTELERRRIEALVERGGACAAAGDGHAYADVNNALHDAILEGAHNRTLGEMAALVRMRLSPYRDGQFVRSERLAGSHAEHQALLERLLARDAEGAAALMRRHIGSTALNVRRMIDEDR